MSRTFRLIALLCAATMLFTACSGPSLTPPESEEESPKEEVVTTGESETEEIPVYVEPVGKPGTKTALAALPIATAEMTEAERRQLCVDFARLQCSFQWTPTHTFRADYTHGTNTFESGVVYGGVPYTQTSSSLYAMLDLYDDATGIVDTSDFAAGQRGNFANTFGNDCADSVFWAWARVSGSIKYTLTKNMTPRNGCLKLGDYTYDEDIYDFSSPTTKGICDDNGEQVMYRAYALCQPADGIVVNSQSEGGGNHTRMISMAAHVEYLPGGAIDGGKSYLTYIDQKSTFSPTTVDGQRVQVVGGIDVQVPFNILFQKGYIPFQIAEVAGLAPVQEASATLEGEIHVDSVADAAILTNYRIVKAVITVTGASGEAVLEKSSYGSEASMYRMSLNTILGGSAPLKRLDAGQYQIKIEVLVGSGQTLTVYEGPITVQ